MSSLNKVTLIGRLGKDPELRYTKDQTPFARFSLATSETFTSGGEKREKTEWHNLVVWGRQAEIAGRYLRKGKQIYVEGRIEYRDYDDPNTGQKRYITDIRVDRFLMLGSPGDHQGGGYGGQADYESGSTYGNPAQGGDYGRQAPQQGGGNYGGRGGGPPQAAPARGANTGPTTYGEPAVDVPESDDFSDDDIPF